MIKISEKKVPFNSCFLTYLTVYGIVKMYFLMNFIAVNPIF